MPREVEERLKREAQQRWPNDQQHQDRYVYGTLNKLEGKKYKGHTFRRRHARR